MRFEGHFIYPTPTWSLPVSCDDKTAKKTDIPDRGRKLIQYVREISNWYLDAAHELPSSDGCNAVR